MPNSAKSAKISAAQDTTANWSDRFRKLNPITFRVLHENKSQGVLYEFTQGARVWKERQRRLLVVGGDLDGQMLTQQDITTSKYPTSYQLYKASGRGYEFPAIWAYTNAPK